MIRQSPLIRRLHDGLPDEFRRHLVEQQHEFYTVTDHRVWREVVARNERLTDEYGHRIHPAYIEGMRALDLPHHIPRIDEINERLLPTGWKTVCVDGYIPTSAYVGLMSSNIFPISRAIRSPDHIDHAPAPDMVHDIFGHLAMLFSPEHREFLKRLATVMTQAVPNELDAELYAANRHMSEVRSASSVSTDELSEAEARVARVQSALLQDASELTNLGRMYLWSVEFGLIGSLEEPEIYGAALLSAPAEFRSICTGDARLVPYSIDVIDRDIAFSDLQKTYFVARDFAHLQEILALYEVCMYMDRRGAKGRASEIRELCTRTDEPRRNYA